MRWGDSVQLVDGDTSDHLIVLNCLFTVDLILLNIHKR